MTISNDQGFFLIKNLIKSDPTSPKKGSCLGGWQHNSNIFGNFHPENWGFMIQFDEHFSDGLVQPPTRISWIFLASKNPDLAVGWEWS